MENCKYKDLHIHSSFDEHKNIKILSFNLAQAKADELIEEIKWNNRYYRITQIINEVKADICFLQEIRYLPEFEEGPNAFLSRFEPHYLSIIDFQKPTLTSMGQAILYDPKKFFPTDRQKQYFSFSPSKLSGTGHFVQCVQFSHVKEGKIVTNISPFWVFNVHFDFEEDIKTKSCHFLLKILEKLTYKQDHVIIGGDFNLFPDKDGEKQRQILTTELTDHGTQMITLNGKKIKGTFIGFENNQFKIDLKNVYISESRLDNIFTRNCSSDGMVVFTRTIRQFEPKELTKRDFPSDHLPIICDIVLDEGDKKRKR